MVSSEEALQEFRETIPIFEVLADEYLLILHIQNHQFRIQPLEFLCRIFLQMLL